MSKANSDSWLTESLKSARAEVAKWPQWKKDAMRVLPDPAPLDKPVRSSGAERTVSSPPPESDE